jgi:hypothetical protein
MKLASTSQVSRLFFGGKRPAARRLAKLNALRLVTAHVLNLNRENLYALTAAGKLWLAEEGVDEAELHLGSIPGRIRDLDHLVAINDLRVALVLAARRHENVTVTLFESDHDLRRFAAGATPAYVPDALVQLTTPGGLRNLVVEIDLGTETAAYYAREKAEHLRHLIRTRQPCWGLPWPWQPVLIAHSARRLSTLAAAVAAVGAAEDWLASDLSVLRVTDILTAPLRALSTWCGAESEPQTLLAACRHEVSLP